MDLYRGRVYLANLGEEGAQPKLWLVVSYNGRNRGLHDALAVRITTTAKYLDLPSVAKIPDGESVQGWVRCDSLTTLYEDEVIREVCAFSRPAMQEVERALKGALGIA